VTNQVLDTVIHFQPFKGFYIMEGLSQQFNPFAGPSTVSVHPLTSSHLHIKQSLVSQEISENVIENI
jgi:hypothetical protein